MSKNEINERNLEKVAGGENEPSKPTLPPSFIPPGLPDYLKEKQILPMKKCPHCGNESTSPFLCPKCKKRY